MVLGAAMSVAVEEKERTASRASASTCRSSLRPETHAPQRTTVEYSQKELRVRALDTAFTMPAAGERVAFEFAEEAGPVRFEGTVIENGEGWTDIAVDLPDMACERRWNSVTFSRRGMWAMNPEGTVDDRFLTGFLMLGRHALYGYRSMIEFLPGRFCPPFGTPSSPCCRDSRLQGSPDGKRKLRRHEESHTHRNRCRVPHGRCVRRSRLERAL